MKTVFLCIPSLASAGAERFVTELACAIDKKNYKVVVVITKIYDQQSAFYKKLLQENIEVINATERYYIKQIFKLRKLINDYSPSIIHTNVSSALYLILPLAFSKSKAKHLFTVHSMGYRIFSGIKKMIMKICFHLNLIVPVAICDTVKKSMIDSYSLAESKIECVYNGVDTSFFKRDKEFEYNKAVLTLVCVGTLYHIKNHELLIDAFKEALGYNDNLKLIIVGDGELRAKLEDKVHKLGLDKAIQFVGNQSNVVPYLLHANVYCCSSTVEGLPISVLEAMSCGLPIITTPAGGVVDIVKNNINGYIVEMNPHDFAEKITYLHNNRNALKKMSEESRQLAQKYDLLNCAHGYEVLYEKYSK